jgi:predicted nuclease of predicted toxin-antitoxin system
VKLLFDNNLSPHLPRHLHDLFPDASHVAFLGLDRASDAVVWQYARDHGYVIVTKDTDFSDLSTQLGWPPKVVWLRIGNCSTAQIVHLLRNHALTIMEFRQAQSRVSCRSSAHRVDLRGAG